MTKNQKLLLGLAAAGLVIYFLWKGNKKTAAPAPNSAEKQCEENYLLANHPDVVRTPEEQEAYKKSWIAECMTMV